MFLHLNVVLGVVVSACISRLSWFISSLIAFGTVIILFVGSQHDFALRMLKRSVIDAV